MTPDSDLQVLGPSRLELGEGARWLGDRFVLVDILAGRLFEVVADVREKLRLLATIPGLPLGAVAPVQGHDRTWIAAVGTGIAVLREPGDLTWLARPEDDNPVPARMNDGVVDPTGRFWAGSMAYDATPGAGSLYRVDHDGSVRRCLTDVTIANGPAFSPDGSVLYLADSARGRIDGYPVDLSTGRLGDAFLVLRLEGASPDGITVDDSGDLWVAVWGQSRVLRVEPTVGVKEQIDLPCAQPTSVAIGGDSGHELLITSASHGLEPPGPCDGAVLVRRVAATAPPARRAVLRDWQPAGH